jgi:hypothetical protein
MSKIFQTLVVVILLIMCFAYFFMNRYEITPIGQGGGLVKFDRWTGSIKVRTIGYEVRESGKYNQPSEWVTIPFSNY